MPQPGEPQRADRAAPRGCRGLDENMVQVAGATGAFRAGRFPATILFTPGSEYGSGPHPRGHDIEPYQEVHP
ncbi:MAG: hypothetical protein KKD63_16685 [Proteobacteria bacterium]|nr:hypothetical protein [Pseudomonadota bacterium]